MPLIIQTLGLGKGDLVVRAYSSFAVAGPQEWVSTQIVLGYERKEVEMKICNLYIVLHQLRHEICLVSRGITFSPKRTSNGCVITPFISS